VVSGRTSGIAVAGGKLSGNLAVIVFESEAAFEEWQQTIPGDTADFLDRCPKVKTPRPEKHVWCLLSDSVPSHKLARLADRTTKIEVKAQGGYVLAPGCPAACHPLSAETGRQYEFEDRGWLDNHEDRTPITLNVWDD
jgi:hypothetical protein